MIPTLSVNSNYRENDEWMIDVQSAIKSYTQNKMKLKQAENLPLHEFCKFGKLDKVQYRIVGSTYDRSPINNSLRSISS